MPKDKKDLVMRDDLPEDLQMRLKAIRDNFLIALVKRAGGTLIFPVKEVDEANDLLTMEVNNGMFILKTQARN